MKVYSSSVRRDRKELVYPGSDTAIELVEVYGVVERAYRAAVMAGETHAGVAYSTNY